MAERDTGKSRDVIRRDRAVMPAPLSEEERITDDAKAFTEAALS